jgi:hypothetical protein
VGPLFFSTCAIFLVLVVPLVFSTSATLTCLIGPLYFSVLVLPYMSLWSPCFSVPTGGTLHVFVVSLFFRTGECDTLSCLRGCVILYPSLHEKICQPDELARHS